jgi:hypothetical protein
MIRQNSRSRSLDFRTIQVCSKDRVPPAMEVRDELADELF